MSFSQCRQDETTITTITGTAGIDAPCDGCDGGDGGCPLLWSPHGYMPQIKGVLLSQNPMRGATAHASPTVSVQTKVCRGLHHSGFAPWAQRGGIQFTPFADATGGSCGDKLANLPHYPRRMVCWRRKKGVRSMDTLVAEMTSRIWRSPSLMAAGATGQI